MSFLSEVDNFLINKRMGLTFSLKMGIEILYYFYEQYEIFLQVSCTLSNLV